VKKNEKRQSTTQRVKFILDFIVAYKKEHGGGAPSIREIADETGLKSTSVVAYYLRLMETEGLIIRRPFLSRDIQVTDRATVG
jgi:repressor LexA